MSAAIVRRRRFWAGVVPVALLAAMAVTVVALLQREDARAQSGLCDTDSAAVTAEELQFVAELQQWRDTVFYPKVTLQLSEPLNKAAAWFAEYQVAAGAPGGHSDNLGRSFPQRATDCGYPGINVTYGIGEGIYGAASSVPIDMSPDDGLAGMVNQVGTSGVYINIDVPPFVKCVGVAKARSADGKRVAWVTLLAQYGSGDCPGAGGTPDGSPTPTSTATTPSPSPSPSASPSSTASPSPSPSPSPTSTVKPPKYFLPLNLAPNGWALVTLPVGLITDVLENAEGCFAAVYQLAGPDDWTRYAPDAPPYASNLTWSSGGAFWILGNGVNCGQIIL